jgi:hypothetical protein
MLSDLLNAMILESKIDADGREVALLELIVREPTQQGTLTHRTVADYYYFEEIVVLSYHCFIIPTVHISERNINGSTPVS